MVKKGINTGSVQSSYQHDGQQAQDKDNCRFCIGHLRTEQKEKRQRSTGLAAGGHLLEQASE